jgi:7-carboxy-7-deazaguanine synthase
MVVRVSEVYASTQGEGPNVGKATVFLRFGGCNLRCAGWPCDTQHAIDPAFRQDWTKWDAVKLADHVADVAELAGAQIITLTGGEPFLQPKRDLESLVSVLVHEMNFQIEAFSNGTILYPDWAINLVNFIMDWKLPGSGENPNDRTRFENLKQLNRSMISGANDSPTPLAHHAIKFVCKDHTDLATAHALWDLNVKDKLSYLEVFYGKVWEGDITDAELVEYVLKNKLPWRLNMQSHQYIWDPNERGR